MKFSKTTFRSCVLAPWLFATLINGQGGSFGWMPGYVNSAGACNVTSELLANYVGCLNYGQSTSSQQFSITNNVTTITYGTGIYAAPFSAANSGSASFPGLIPNGYSTWTTFETPYNCTLFCRAHGMKYSQMVFGLCNCSPYISPRPSWQQYFYGSIAAKSSPDTLYSITNPPGTACSYAVGYPTTKQGNWGDAYQGYQGWETGTAGGNFALNYANTTFYPASINYIAISTWVDNTFASDSTLVLSVQVNNYGYLGCFIMSSTTTSFMPLGFSNNFTTTSQCYTFCAQLNMPYAGMAYQTGSLPVSCRCGAEFAAGSYQYLPDAGQCNYDCNSGSTTSCTVGSNCCGNSQTYFSVYRNPDLLGCYEPPVPGTSLVGTATYPVACFSTVFAQTLATSKSFTYSNPWSAAVGYTANPIATPPAQYKWDLSVSNYPQYKYIGCYTPSAFNILSASSGKTMNPDLCAASCNTTGAAYFGMSYNMTWVSGTTTGPVNCFCGNSMSLNQPDQPFGYCNSQCYTSTDKSAPCGGRNKPDYTILGGTTTTISGTSTVIGGSLTLKYVTTLGMAVYGPATALNTIVRTIPATSTYSCVSISSTTSSTIFTSSSSSSIVSSTSSFPSSSSTSSFLSITSSSSQTTSTSLGSVSSSQTSSSTVVSSSISSSNSAQSSSQLSSSATSSSTLTSGSVQSSTISSTIPVTSSSVTFSSVLTSSLSTSVSSTVLLSSSSLVGSSSESSSLQTSSALSSTSGTSSTESSILSSSSVTSSSVLSSIPSNSAAVSSTGVVSSTVSSSGASSILSSTVPFSTSQLLSSTSSALSTAQGSSTGAVTTVSSSATYSLSSSQADSSNVQSSSQSGSQTISSSGSSPSSAITSTQATSLSNTAAPLSSSVLSSTVLIPIQSSSNAAASPGQSSTVLSSSGLSGSSGVVSSSLASSLTSSGVASSAGTIGTSTQSPIPVGSSTAPYVCPTIPANYPFSSSIQGAFCVATTISFYPACTPLSE